MNNANQSIMNKLDLQIKKIHSAPETISFQETIDIIDDFYHYSPSQFTNGYEKELITNKAGSNEGSCKIFAFAKLHELDDIQTLNCFGDYYRIDVLQNPENEDHANIRTFMTYGLKHILFSGSALTKK